MLEPIGDTHVLDEVTGVGVARLAAAVIENEQPARAGDEMHLIAAELGVRRAVAVIERKALRGGLDGAVDHLRRKQDPLRGIGGARHFQPAIEQQLAHALPAYLDADFGQDALRLVENRADEGIRNDAKLWPHVAISASRAWRMTDGR